MACLSRLEIFRPAGATAPHLWQFCFLHYSPFPKTIKVLQSRSTPRQINADTLRDVFTLIFAPLQDLAHDGVPIDCTDGKVWRCFPILTAWIADHMENVALYGIISNVCPRCEVPAVELCTNIKVYPVRDYAIYHY